MLLPQHRTRICYGIFLVIAVLIMAGLAGLYWPQINKAMHAIEPNCTIGVTGTAATVTVQAWTANNDCHQVINGETAFLSGPLPPKTVYEGTQDTTAPVVCELDMQGRHIIVRDRGLLKLVGNLICQELYKQQEKS